MFCFRCKDDTGGWLYVTGCHGAYSIAMASLDTCRKCKCQFLLCHVSGLWYSTGMCVMLPKGSHNNTYHPIGRDHSNMGCQRGGVTQTHSILSWTKLKVCINVYHPPKGEEHHINTLSRLCYTYRVF